jgi:DNA-binding NarL/FixJ family response regulator
VNVRVLIADDHAVVRQGLRALIESRTTMTVVGEASNGRMALQLARELSPHVVVMDVTMPDMNGIEATRQLVKGSKHTKVVALSMHSERRLVVEMLKAGASAFVLKEYVFDELLNAIHSALADRKYLSPKLVGIMVDDYARKAVPGDPSPAEALTAREREVLQLLAEGATMRGISLKLHVSIKTIETHRKNVMRKLKTHSIAELTKHAIREGLTSLDT